MMYIIRKNTYKIKDSLKAVGCKWNNKYKVWVFPNKEATKGFNFEIVESLAKLEIPPAQDRIYKKPFSASCCTVNCVIIREDTINSKINLYTAIGRGEHEGKTFFFYGLIEKYSVGEILENIPCKIDFRQGNSIVLKYRLDV